MKKLSKLPESTARKIYLTAVCVLILTSLIIISLNWNYSLSPYLGISRSISMYVGDAGWSAILFGVVLSLTTIITVWYLFKIYERINPGLIWGAVVIILGVSMLLVAWFTYGLCESWFCEPALWNVHEIAARSLFLSILAFAIWNWIKLGPKKKISRSLAYSLAGLITLAGLLLILTLINQPRFGILITESLYMLAFFIFLALLSPTIKIKQSKK